VVEIGLFTTILNTSQNLRVIIPNSAVYGRTITNYSANDTRRIDLTLGIAYEDDIGSALRIVEEVVARDDRVLGEPAPVFFVGELADSAVNLVIRSWCSRSDVTALRSDLLRTLKEGLEAGGCTMPFPQRDLHIVSAPPTTPTA
jgi:small conductance mechanosensitive channel